MMRLLLVAILLGFAARAEDWPQFLGPRRDGSYSGEISTNWPKEGPKRTWQKDVGPGFAGPVIAQGKVFIFHRADNEEKIECLDAAMGKTLWSNGYASTYRDDFGFDNGPRAVPAVADGRVFTYGADGIISAVGVRTGTTLWRVDAKKDFASKKGFFGRAPSPLVVGDLALFNVGGDGSGIVALDVTTGKLRWKASNDEASYSSPTLAVFDGKTNALFVTRHEFVGLEPASGKVLFQNPFGPTENASVTAATPLVNGDLVFLSGCYGAGSTALQLKNGKPAKIWASDDVMLNHYATCVHRGDLLFGFDGRQEQGAAFACIDWKTGKLLWRKEHFGAGSVLIAGDKLVILLESGELVLAEANGAAYKELQRAQVIGSGNRAYPAIAAGFLYARDKTKLVRLNVSNSAN
ncbi:MAG TPA: PQQ-binding-like beta-propeller repeat protein [Verrucomicrobiae bacterium]|nr:PQQ-binding-like beta-propeller repeat protein [Verrucomicrobiae bacterium]